MSDKNVLKATKDMELKAPKGMTLADIYGANLEQSNLKREKEKYGSIICGIEDKIIDKAEIEKMEKGKYPIMEFKNNKELNECLRWWQDKLMLNDWLITAKLSDKMLDLDGQAVEGMCDSIYVSKCAYIDIVTKDCAFEYLKKMIVIEISSFVMNISCCMNCFILCFLRLKVKIHKYKIYLMTYLNIN